ncbi:MAG: hypothetical protein WDZ94_03040 [Patescibacteria group bacterium]
MKPIIHQSLSVANKRTAISQLEKIRSSQTALSIFILLLVAVLLWIVVTVFSSHRSSQIEPDVKALAAPLNPNIDTTALDMLETKRVFSENELEDFPIFVIIRDDQAQFDQIVPLGTQPIPVEQAIEETPSTPQPAAETPTASPTTPDGVVEPEEDAAAETEAPPATE